MKTRLQLDGMAYEADLEQPLDISIPIVGGTDAVNCFYAPPAEFIPVREGSFFCSFFFFQAEDGIRDVR